MGPGSISSLPAMSSYAPRTELANESGSFIKPLFGQAHLAVETKADASPVTVADRGAEELMRKRIVQRYPDHGMLIAAQLGAKVVKGEMSWG